MNAFGFQAEYVRHMDSGHSWLEVPFRELVELRIEFDITGYSYMRGTRAFLEEDCDMQVFLKARRLECSEPKIVEEWTLEEGSTFSVIRKYDRYDPDDLSDNLNKEKKKKKKKN